MKLPVDIREISSASKRAREEREKPLRIAVFIDPDAPDVLVEAVRERFRPQTAGARLHLAVAEEGVMFTLAPDADAVIALVGAGTPSMKASLAAAREQYVPTAVLALESGRDAVSARLEHPVLDTIAGVNADELIDGKLGDWLADRLSGKRLALACNFTFMRKPVAEESVKATAFQNAVIGVVAIIPGADMPIMIANESKMFLQIAAAYGQPLGAERIKELAAVVGGGLALRTIARELLAFVPGVGWALKGGIAYAGTLAMGMAAIAYFERGFDAGEVMRQATAARDRAIVEAKARIGRGERVALPSSASEVALSGYTLAEGADDDGAGMAGASDA
jgi:uncharacterized protein (DUF697 family)